MGEECCKLWDIAVAVWLNNVVNFGDVDVAVWVKNVANYVQTIVLCG